MSRLNCCCNSSWSCTGIGIIAGIIIGIITAFLTFSAIITVTPVFLWVAFGIAVVYLAVTFVTAAVVRNSTVRSCICRSLPSLLAGILGTVLISLILLAVEFAATSVIGAIFTGLLLAFFTIILTSTACISICAADCGDSTAVR